MTTYKSIKYNVSGAGLSNIPTSAVTSGTFDTNDLTILYGSSKIQGASANLDVGTERAGFGLVYYNSTQGWLLTEK